MTDLRKELAECVEALDTRRFAYVEYTALVARFIRDHHAALDEALRDAERYRWFRVLTEEAGQVLGTWAASGDPAFLDELIDQAMAGEGE